MNELKIRAEIAALDDMIQILVERCTGDRIVDAILREMMDTTESLKECMEVAA